MRANQPVGASDPNAAIGLGMDVSYINTGQAPESFFVELPSPVGLAPKESLALVVQGLVYRPDIPAGEFEKVFEACGDCQHGRLASRTSDD